MRYIINGEVPGNPSTDTSQGGTRGPMRDPTPTTPWRASVISGFLPLGGAQRVMPSGGVPREGLKSDRLTGPLFAPPRAGHNSDPGGWKPPPTAVPTV